jgi:hypothetical protein
MQGGTDMPQERVVRMPRGCLLKPEQCSPIGLEVDIGGRYEITEDAHSVHVLNCQPGPLDQGSEAGRVEAPRQGIRRTPSAVVAGERVLSLGELASQGSGKDGGDTGGDHEADVSAVGKDPGDGLQGRSRVINELQGAVTAHEVGVSVGVDFKQVGGVTLHCHNPLGDPGVAGSTVQRGERVEAGVDDRDVMAKLGQWDGHATRATAKIDNAKSPAKLLLALDHDGPHGLPDGRGSHGGLDVPPTAASPFVSHGKAPLVLVVAGGHQA